MHYAPLNHIRLFQIHRVMKVVLTMYIASVVVAMGVGVLKYTDRGQWSPSGVATLVRGSEDVADDPFGDPLAGTPEGLAQHEGMSNRELVDVAHPHLFTVPIILFILGHLLNLTRLPDAWKLGVSGTAFGSFFATFLLPFLVTSHAALAPALFVAGTLFMVSVGALCALLLYELWWGKAPNNGTSASNGRLAAATSGGWRPPPDDSRGRRAPADEGERLPVRPGPGSAKPW